MASLACSISLASCKSEPAFLKEEFVVVRAKTSCHPIPIPGEVCPDALSEDEQLELRGTLDMCVPHAWTPVRTTDSGYDFEAKANQVDGHSMQCLRRHLSKKAKIERVRH
jgi:hypothetical protein